MKEPKWFQFFQDETGKFSSMRLGFLITIVPVMILWTLFSYKDSLLLDIPKGIDGLVSILAGGKLGQLWVHKYYSGKKIKNIPCSNSKGVFSKVYEWIKKRFK